MSTGVQMAHNLIWKLAFAIPGSGTPDILHSYEKEQRPIADYLAHSETVQTQQIQQLLPILEKEDWTTIKISWRAPRCVIVVP